MGAAPSLAVVGASVRDNCGTRDHATLLAGALQARGVSLAQHWLERRRPGLAAARAEMRAWTRHLAADLDERPPDAVLWHYSVFSYSYRGVPLFVHPTLSAMRSSRIPLLAMMHELAYPWRYSGLRGDVWALSQRAALIEVFRASAAGIVTAETRAQWLASRAWLPSLPIRVAPVFSNLPAPQQLPAQERTHLLVGLFGYSYESAAVALPLDALALLRGTGADVRLRLLGAPGRDSAAGETWLAEAGSRGLQEALSFSGALPAQALSNELAACDVLLFGDAAGPSSRKGTLAASLASGRPVVAIDGPNCWRRLVQADAVCLAQPSPAALARSIASLLEHPARREQLGARGLGFAATEMGIARTADAVLELLALVAGAR